MQAVSRWVLFSLILSLSAFGQLEFNPRVKLTDPISCLEASRIVDMDGDGDIDVAAIGRSLELDWFENDGHGNFTRHDWKPEQFLSEQSLDQTIIGIADYDGDGRQDIWIEEDEYDADYNRRYWYLVAKGQVGGGFSSPMSVAVPPDDFIRNGSYSLVADLNGDGFFDIVEAGLVFLSTPERIFQAPIPIPLPPNVELDIQSDQFLDYDEDGDLDLFIKHYHQILYCKNTGGGHFAAPIVLLQIPEDQELHGFGFVHSNIIGTPPRLVAYCTSIDGPGVEKLLLYERKNDGTTLKIDEFTLPQVEGLDRGYWWFFRSDSSSKRTFLCCWPGLNEASQLHELKYGEQGLTVTLLSTHQGITNFDFTGEADLNGDGFEDLVVMIPWMSYTVGSATDHILWYPGQADGSFQETPAAVVPAAYERHLKVADDFDGDGDTDLMFGLISPFGGLGDVSHLAVWSNHGNGTDFVKRTITIPGSSQTVLGVEDFVTQPVQDGHTSTVLPFPLPAGRKDFIIRSDYSHRGGLAGNTVVQLVLQSSQGEFYVKSIMSEVGGSLIYYEDWDGDGARDLLFYRENGELSWSKRNGYEFGKREQIMTFPTNPYYDSQSTPFALLDMDRDGDLDIYGRGGLFGPDSSYWAERDAAGVILSFRKLNSPLELLYFDADGDSIREAIGLFGSSGGIHPIVDYHFENTDLDSISYNHSGLFDFDADGDFDSFVSAPTFSTQGFQRLIWHENQGDGPSFTNETGVEFAGLEISYRNQFAHKDMDGDGMKDFLVISQDSALVEWFKITKRSGPKAFEDWMAGQNLTGSSAGPMSDWDMDGRRNWEEFIYGTKAKVHDSAQGLEPHIEKTPTGMDFAYTRRKSGSGLTLNYGMQKSRTLNGDWEPWNPEIPPPTATGDYENIRIPIIPGENAEFFRVRLPEIPE